MYNTGTNPVGGVAPHVSPKTGQLQDELGSLSLPDPNSSRDSKMTHTRNLQTILSEWGSANIDSLREFIKNNRKFVEEIADDMPPKTRRQFLKSLNSPESNTPDNTSNAAEWLLRNFSVDGIYGPRTALLHRAYLESSEELPSARRSAYQEQSNDLQPRALSPLNLPPNLPAKPTPTTNPEITKETEDDLNGRALVAPPNTNSMGETYYVSRRPLAVEKAVGSVLTKSLGKFPQAPVILESHEVRVERKDKSGFLSSRYLNIERIDNIEGVGAVIEGKLDGEPRSLAYFYEPTPRIVFAPPRNENSTAAIKNRFAMK